MTAGWPSRRLAWRRPVLMPGTWRGGAPRRWRDPRPLRHPGRPGISRHKQGARGLPAERHAAAGAPNPSTASTRPASARTTYRTHPDTAITAEPALAYCQGRALPSRYETLPEMASAVQGNETIPYRRLFAPGKGGPGLVSIAPDPAVMCSGRCRHIQWRVTPRGRQDTVEPHGAAASTTQAGPRAKVMGLPVVVVNVVPPLASGRDQRMA